MSNTIIKCMCCYDPSEKENPILSCNKCEVTAHVLCYGILDGDNFVCSPCSRDIKPESIKCDLCQKPNGCMKLTTEENWVHVLCALFTTGVVFHDMEQMEPIDITKVPKSLMKVCAFCNEKSICMKCNRKGCQRYIHVSCGFENETLKETLDSKQLLSFFVYCSDHVQMVKQKRLSSDNLKHVVRSKVVSKHVAKAVKLNANWVYAKVMKKSDEPNNSLDDTSHDENDSNLSAILLDDSMNESNLNERRSTNVSQTDISTSSRTTESSSLCNQQQDDFVSISDVLESELIVVDESNQQNNKNQNEIESNQNEHLHCNDDPTIHSCYKDMIIRKLQFEKKSLSNELNSLYALNQELHVQLLRKLSSSKATVQEKSDESVQNHTKESVQKSPEESIQEEPPVNQPKMSEKANTNTQNLSNSKQNDGKYVNGLINVNSLDGFITSLKKNDSQITDKAIKAKFLESDDCQQIKELYETRIEIDGIEKEARKKKFKDLVYKKIDNRLTYIRKKEKSEGQSSSISDGTNPKGNKEESKSSQPPIEEPKHQSSGENIGNGQEITQTTTKSKGKDDEEEGENSNTKVAESEAEKWVSEEKNVDH